MKRIVNIVWVAALLVAGVARAQGNRQISGTVTDPSGAPVIGASVMVPKTTNGAITDLDGKYTLSIASSVRDIEISSIGFVSQTLTLGPSAVYDVVLMEDTENLEEVVVVGYGVQKKINLTGAVASVEFNKESMASRPMTNATSALAGAIPGLSVMQSSGNPYEEDFAMTIRGTGTLNSSGPLVLVDGMEQSIGNVNPSDIATITVLKDAASCAIYGNRGANGVILVTTKNGSDSKIEVTFDATFSYDQPFKIIHTVSDYATYMELMNESSYNIGGSMLFAQSTIDEWRAAKADPWGRADSGYYNYMAYPNTDWWDVIYKDNIMQKYAVTVNGKDKRIGYNVSLSYIDKPGIIENSGYKRYFARVNAYGDITDWLRVGGRIWGYHTDQSRADLSLLSGIGGQKLVPGVYPYSKSLGLYGAPEANEEDPQSHNALWDMNSSRGYTKNTQAFVNMYAQVKLFKVLHWNTDIFYKDYRQEEQSINNGFGKYSFRADSYIIPPPDPSELYSWMYNKRENQFKFTTVLNWIQTFGKHDVSVMAGYEAAHFGYSDFDSTKRGLQDTRIGDLNAVAEPISSGGYHTEYASRSFFGRANYSYAGKYLFEANVRVDGSSRFAPEHRWGVFPSFSAGWRISEEPWLKNWRPLSNLKIRASWGRLGNNAIGNYDWQSTYGTAKYVIGNNISNGIAITALKNYALTWETTAVTNVGLDFSFFSDRLSGSVEFYDKLTSGILYTPAMFMVMGNATAPKQNIASVNNRGVELELGWRDSIGSDFHYAVRGNFPFNRNWVSKYKGTLSEGWMVNPQTGEKTWTTNIGDVSTGSSTRIVEGRMINEFYMMDPYQGSGTYWNADGSVDKNGGPVDGMIRTPDDMAWLRAMMADGYTFYPHQGIGKDQIWYGEYIYADRNGDGLYGSSYDARFQDVSTTPKINYGFQIELGWKGIDFSMNWTGAAGFSIYYYRQATNSSSTTYGYAIPQSVADDHYFFDPKNPADPRTNLNSPRPRLVNMSSAQSEATSSLHLEKGDFLKLRSVSLGYTFPKKWTEVIKMQKLRIYASGENLFAFTAFSGMDPEMRAASGYSTIRQWALGINITF